MNTKHKGMIIANDSLTIKIIPPRNKDGVIPQLPEIPNPEYINEVFTIFPKKTKKINKGGIYYETNQRH